MTDHKAQWLARYADDYPTEAEREDAYREHQRALAELRAVFAGN